MRARPKPDPSRGVFETMLVVRGEPVALEAHLSRLETSLDAVYGAKLPARIREIVAEHAEGLELGRLRLTFVPAGGIEVESGEIDRSLHFPEHAISLRSRTVRGGLGCHKWTDRRAIPLGGKGEATLLVDGDEVLEADRANVFAVRTGALFTPPLDERILPGVTRATVIELARSEGTEVVESIFTLEELRECEEAFLTNSIRGIERIDSVDGIPLGSGDRLTRLVEAGLRRRWSLVAEHPARVQP